jgi:hypothetical protein
VQGEPTTQRSAATQAGPDTRSGPDTREEPDAQQGLSTRGEPSPRRDSGPGGPRAAGWPRRAWAELRRLARENKLFSWALAGGVLLRLLIMAGYPGALWFSGDSYVYLGAALRPIPDRSKPTGYSFFLRALLPFHSLTLVTSLQHLMGLSVAVMIYVLARRFGVPKKWAAIATLPQLFDGLIILDEHLIMAESVFTFCMMLATLLVLWKPRPAWWAALLAGLLAGYGAIAYPTDVIVIALLPLFVLIRGLRACGWRRLRGWLAAIAVAAGCLIPVGGYVAWFHSYAGSWDLSTAEGFYLWGRVSSFADCADIRAPADVMKYCPTEPFRDRTPPGQFIWFAPQVHADMNSVGGPVSIKGNQLLEQFDLDAIKSQPLGYVKAVVKGMLMSLKWPMENYPGAGTVYYYKLHLHYVLPPKDQAWVPPLTTADSAYSDWMKYGRQAPGAVVEPFAILIGGYERLFNTLGPLFGVIMVMGLGGVITVTRRPLRLRWRRRRGSMFPWVTAVVMFAFPIAAADFDYRYLLPVIAFASLAAGLAFAPPRDEGTAAPPSPPSPPVTSTAGR